MAVCPWCKVTGTETFLMDNRTAYCMSKSNPDVGGDRKLGSAGVAWNRCVRGEKVNGLGYK